MFHDQNKNIDKRYPFLKKKMHNEEVSGIEEPWYS